MVKALLVSGHAKTYPYCFGWAERYDTFKSYFDRWSDDVVCGLVPQEGKGWSCKSLEDKWKRNWLSTESYEKSLSDPSVRIYAVMAHGGADSFGFIPYTDQIPDFSCEQYCATKWQHGTFGDFFNNSIEELMEERGPIGLAFLGHCGAMNETGEGTFEYAYRKGESKNTCVIGQKNTTYDTIRRQTLFIKMLLKKIDENRDTPIKQLYDETYEIYGEYNGTSIMDFTGDTELTLNQILAMTRFEDFKRDCLSNGSVTCNWDVLHSYLIDRTVADNWWNLTREERNAIADIVIPSIPKLNPTKCYTGDYDCAGTNLTDHGKCVCQNWAEIQIARYNCPDVAQTSSNHYWSDKDGNIHCYTIESYYLPVYFVSMPYQGHTMCAMLMEEEGLEYISSWRIFQFHEYNVDFGSTAQINRPGYIEILYPGQTYGFYINKDGSACEPANTGCWEYSEYQGKVCIDCEWVVPHTSTLSLIIQDINGNPITEASVGDIIILTGTLKDTKTDEPLQGVEVWQTINNYPWQKDITDENGNYSMHYKIEEDSDTVITFKVKTMDYFKVNNIVYEPVESEEKNIYIEGKAHNTLLSIDIQDVNGNPIFEAYVGDTVYIIGALTDAETGDLLQNAEITLYRNSTKTNLTDMTNENGEYSIPYTVVEADYPSVKFKTKFAGSEA